MTSFNDLLEKLRLQAEADTVDAGTDKRRPSWGPALVLDDTLIAAFAGLNYPPLDKPVARLWATFANPSKVGRYLRVNVSPLPMPEVRCRAFELRLGTKRSGERLLQAKRDNAGLWSIDAHIPSHFAGWPEHQQARRNFERAQGRVTTLTSGAQSHATEWAENCRKHLPEAEAELIACKQKFSELDAVRTDYHRRREALGETIKQRVAAFAGDSRVEMIAGARVTGNCAICGRGLNDPMSLERGIGPECFAFLSPSLHAHVAVLSKGASHG